MYSNIGSGISLFTYNGKCELRLAENWFVDRDLVDQSLALYGYSYKMYLHLYLYLNLYL